MAWLRLDDRFANHPKVVGLSDREFRVWIRTLLYCAAYRTKGAIPDRSPIPGLTPKVLEKLRNVGLLDVIDGKNCVHDWAEYNPIATDAATRMRRNREAVPRVSQGRWAKVREQVFERDQGVCAACGDRDEDAFAKGLLSGWNADHEPSRAELTTQGLDIYDLAFIVTLCHSCHAKKTRREATASKTEPRPNLQPNQVEVGSPLARASAPVPVPSRPQVQETPNGVSSDFSKNGHHDDPAGVRRVYDHWRQVRGKRDKRYEGISDKRRAKIKARLREFSVDELLRALDAVALDDWPGRDAHDDLTVLLGSREKVDRWLDKAEGKGVVAEHLSREQRRELADRRLRERMAERGVQ